MKSVESGNPHIFTLELHEDDPAKCTSAKMRKLGLARTVISNRISRDAIILDPFAEATLLKSDGDNALKYGLVVIDCSWVKASGTFKKKYNGHHRKLPALIAGNPTNYAKLYSLSSVEATAAALYIMNFYDAAQRLLNIYKWGATFFSLNHEALDEYSQAESVQEMQSIEKAYFPQTQP